MSMAKQLRSLLRCWNLQTTPCRHLKQMSSSIAVGALRAFYLSVHPDFFAQHPRIQKVNETSLKRLNNYLDAIQCSRQVRHVEPTKVTFYFRKQAPNTSVHRDDFKQVNFTLRSQDLLTNIEHILVSCDLSAEHLVDIAKSPRTNENTSSKQRSWDEIKTEETVSRISMRKWLRRNIGSIIQHQSNSRPIIESNESFKSNICLNYGIADIDWCSPWQHDSEQGILRNFVRLCNQHKEQMKCLRGRKLVFTDQTVIAADGSIGLNVEDVPQQWLQCLSKFEVEFSVVNEEASRLDEIISEHLGGVKVVRPKVCMPRFREHELISLYNYLSIVGTLWSKMQSCEHHNHILKADMMNKQEITFVKLQDVKSETIKVEPHGRLRVDKRCDPMHLLEYISENKVALEEKRNMDASAKARSLQLTKVCEEKLGIRLTNDFDVDYEQMTSCCEQLLRNATEFASIKGLEMRITSNYYAVFDGGQFYIPWNWKV